MRVCVYGAGAIGGYLAASLAEAGAAEVSVVARGAHLAAIRANGLTVETPERRFTAPLAASDNPADLGTQDLVIVTVKAPALGQVAAGIGPLLQEGTTVAFPMNGIPWWYYHGIGGADEGRQIALLDPGGALWRAVGPARAVGAIVWPACSVPAPGVVRLLSGAAAGTVFGEPDGSASPRLDAIASLFAAAGLGVSTSADIRALIWRKLAVNLCTGPLCVLGRADIAAAMGSEDGADAPLADAARGLLGEACALAAAMGYPLDLDPARILSGNRRVAHRPSILQDLEAGRPMEVEALYGVPLQMAAEQGVAMPLLALLSSLVRLAGRA
ncbi:MAG: 2-dehydropantoate 2-reductase [Rhodospirillales bacterium]|nr:2-dehydropantoate 2-reductase [Rhodospirillales bacterium]